MDVKLTFDEINVRKEHTVKDIRILMVKGEKGDAGVPTDEQVKDAVEELFDEHPEWITNIPDNSITTAKLQNNSVTEDKLSESLQSLLITDTASGSIASFSDGSDGIPIKGLEVGIEPKQDLHGYSNPWPAGGGKNLLDMYGVSENGKNYLSKNVFAKAGTYTVSVTGINGNYATYVREAGTEGSSAGAVVAEKVSQGNLTFTLANDTAIMVQWYAPNDTSGTLTGKTFQLESGSTATSYAPYSNICPITGWENVKVTRTGKNLIFDYTAWPSSYGLTGSIIPNSGGGVRFTGIPTWATASARTFRIADAPDVKAKFGDVASIKVFCNSSYCSVNSAYFNSSDNAIVVNCNTPATTQSITVDFYIFVYTGSEPIAFESFKGDTYNISLSSAGTVYGGTLNVTTGLLTVNKAFSEIKSNWNWHKSTVYPGGYYTSGGLSYKTNTPFICSHVKTATNLSEYVYGTCYCDNSINFRLMDSNSTVQDWKNYIDAQSSNGTPITICYSLSTPTTVQLTPQQITTLLGENNVWSDAGDSSVSYVADTKLYINKMIANALNS